MKFLALVKKEFRECLPWVCLAGIVFAALGTALLYGRLRVEQLSRQVPSERYPGVLISYSPLQNMGPLLLIVALALGIVLGIRQFLAPGLDKTWSFTLHRPTPAWTIAMAKLLAAGLGLAVSVGLPWVLLYLYAARPGRFQRPVLPAVFLEGCLMILLGMVAHLGAAVSAMRPVRWYTTRVFGVAFGAGVCLLCLMGTPLAHAWVLAAAGAFVLAVQVVHAVGSREV